MQKCASLLHIQASLYHDQLTRFQHYVTLLLCLTLHRYTQASTFNHLFLISSNGCLYVRSRLRATFKVSVQKQVQVALWHHRRKAKKRNKWMMCWDNLLSFWNCMPCSPSRLNILVVVVKCCWVFALHLWCFSGGRCKSLTSALKVLEAPQWSINSEAQKTSRTRFNSHRIFECQCYEVNLLNRYVSLLQARFSSQRWWRARECDEKFVFEHITRAVHKQKSVTWFASDMNSADVCFYWICCSSRYMVFRN